MKTSAPLYSVFVSFAAPFSWIAQMAISQIVISNACYPHERPLAAPLWGGLPEILTVVNIACLAGGMICSIYAWKNLLEVQKKITDHQENRTHFMAVLCCMSSFLSVIAILFTGCANFLVLPCSQWR